MFFGGSNNLFISCFLHFLLLPHLLLLHSDDGGDVGLGALWAALEPHYPVRGAAEHIGDPGPFSKVHQCGDWVSMTTFVHAPHTAAESTLNHLVSGRRWRGVLSSDNVGGAGLPVCGMWGLWAPFPPDCFQGWQTLMHSCICPAILVESEIGLSACCVPHSVRRASGEW